MGWCSGTPIFDAICADVIDSELPTETQRRIVRVLVDALEAHDWDCQSDSTYYEHIIVQDVMKELHPDWFDDDFSE